MQTVPAMGQFGDDTFWVSSKKYVPVRAKYLRDVTGKSYIIDPKTGLPYKVPADYEPSATAAYFSKLSRMVADTPTLPGQMPTPVVGVYPELSRAFKVGGWGDIQRPCRTRQMSFRISYPLRASIWEWPLLPEA
jgi:hypothetical protein